MPPRAGARPIAGTGGRSGASSLRSSSQPPGPATTRARTSPPPWRRALEASSSKTSSRPSRASSVDAEQTDGCAMRARRSLRTRDTTCMASSCQCQTSPGTEGTGAHGHASWAGFLAISRAIASPSRSVSQAGPGRCLAEVHPDRWSSGPHRGAGERHLTGRMAGMQQLLRDLARVVLADRTLEETLGEITSLASTGIPGAEATSITLVRNDKAFTAAYDGEMALAADELQYEQDYGPCMDAGRGGVVLRVDDIHTEQRWPEYVRRVRADTPVRSSLSVPLPYQGASIGALNIYPAYLLECSR